MPKNMDKNIQHVFVDPSGKHVLLASSKQIIYLSNDHTSAKVVSEDDVWIFTSVDHEFFYVKLVGCCPPATGCADTPQQHGLGSAASRGFARPLSRWYHEGGDFRIWTHEKIECKTRRISADPQSSDNFVSGSSGVRSLHVWYWVMCSSLLQYGYSTLR